MSTPSTTLTDRYVAAAVRTVSEQQRDDLAAELRVSIDDQIDARVEQGEPRDSAERAVLSALGDPDKLAADYTDRPLWLVGPRYYLDWWRLLRLLLWVAVPFAGLGVGIAEAIQGSGIGEIIGAVISTMIAVAVHVAFWTTLVFAIVERTRPRSSGPAVTWSVDQLPVPRERGVGFGELLASLVFLGLGAGAIIWDQAIGFVPGQPGLSLLDPGLWPWWIAALFVLMAIEAGLQVVVFLVGRWTVPLAIGNALIDVAVAVPALVLLAEGRLINPAFFPAVIPDDGAEVGAIVTIVTGFAIAGIAVWDIVDAFLKARRSRRPGL
jgi:HAAS